MTTRPPSLLLHTFGWDTTRDRYPHSCFGLLFSTCEVVCLGRGGGGNEWISLIFSLYFKSFGAFVRAGEVEGESWHVVSCLGGFGARPFFFFFFFSSCH